MIVKSLIIPEVGSIILEKKTGQKSLRLRIHPDKGAIVSVPKSISEAEARKFVLNNIEWLKSKLAIVEKQKQNNLFLETSEFITRKHTLKIERFSGSGAIGKVNTDGSIVVKVAEKVEFENENLQKFIVKIILKALYNEAAFYLPQRLQTLAAKHSFSYKSLSIGKAGKTWGSCKSDNTIRLSCRLMLLPDELLDYIILHELCHTVHKNHGEKFKSLLNEITQGKSNYYNRQLKKYTTKIIPGNYNYSENQRKS